MLKIYQVDAFTKRIFGGNPAAVIPLQNWLADATLQAIAEENNLSETAFFVQKADHFALRWFTPVAEVDLCGHATLASAHVLFQHLNYTEKEILFHTKSGILSVQQNDDFYCMNFPSDSVQTAAKPDYLEDALGISVQEFYRGKDDFLAIIDNETQVRMLQPNFSLLHQLTSRGLIVSAKGEKVDFVSRCFFPKLSIDEDPVTGSAHTLLTPYWAKKLGKNDLHAKQISKRSGELRCIRKGERVELYGEAVTYMEGSLQIKN